jgi:hypothetical protein
METPKKLISNLRRSMTATRQRVPTPPLHAQIPKHSKKLKIRLAVKRTHEPQSDPLPPRDGSVPGCVLRALVLPHQLYDRVSVPGHLHLRYEPGAVSQHDTFTRIQIAQPCGNDELFQRSSSSATAGRHAARRTMQLVRDIHETYRVLNFLQPLFILAVFSGPRPLTLFRPRAAGNSHLQQLCVAAYSDNRFAHLTIRRQAPQSSPPPEHNAAPTAPVPFESYVAGGEGGARSTASSEPPSPEPLFSDPSLPPSASEDDRAA